MTKRELNLRIFQRKPVTEVLFQPRFEPWVAWHKDMDKMPERYRGMEIRDFYDDLGVSMRYVHYHTGMPDPVRMKYSDKVKWQVREEPNRRYITIGTPYGDLHEEQWYTIDKTWRTVKFYGKDREDMKRLRWLIEQVTYSFVPGNFQKGSEYVGDRGVPQFWVPKSPYQAMAQSWCGFEDFIMVMAEYPEDAEEVMRALDEKYDPIYDGICASAEVNIVNFGENIHSSLFSPKYIDKYYLPFYEKRVGQLHAAGKFAHIHWDGYVKPVQRYLKLVPFDGIEALTPAPQGDFTLDELKGWIGDKILLDGIPAVLFLETFSRDELAASVEKVVKLFHPNLVLGISDELPEGSGEESMERVRWVADMVRKMRV